MSQEVKLKARIQNKYETLEKWNELTREDDFVPLKGEVCYGTENNMLYQKIGDGSTNFVDLPWLINQADQDENNENSPAYIKNRLAYEDYETVPENEQDMGTTIFGASPSYPVEDMLREGLEFPEEQIKSIKENYFTFQKDSDSPYVVDNLHVTSGAILISSELESLTADENNKFTFSLGTQENYKTKFNFDYKIKPMNPIYGDDPELKYFNYIGNPAWASLMFYQYVGTDYEYPFDLSNEEELQLDYGFLTIGPIGEDGEMYMTILGFVDSNKYLPHKTIDSSDPESEPEELFSFSWTINHVERLYTKTIDKKYLGEIQADQRTIDSTKGSYIKNRFGEMAIIHMDPSASDYPYDPMTATITLGSGSGTAGFNLISEVKSKSNYDDYVFQICRTYTVVLNDKIYKHCPIYNLGTTLVSDRGIGSDYYLGNPNLLPDLFGLGLEDAEIENEYIIGNTISVLDNNNLPFLFNIEPKKGQIVNFKEYGSNSTINIKIYQEELILYSKPVTDILLPEQYLTGLYDSSKNSVLLNSSYEASGRNSLAANYGTKAQGSNSMALGYETTATGENDISTGYNTYTSGKNSIIGGNSNRNYSENSLVIGLENINYGNNSLIIGKKAENRLDNVFIAGAGQIEDQIRNGTYEFINSARTKCKYTAPPAYPEFYKGFWSYDAIKFSENGTEIPISSIELLPEEHSCIINLRNSVSESDSMYNAIFIKRNRAEGYQAGEWGMIVGTGSSIEGTGIALGEGLEANAHQTVIGSYNTPSDNENDIFIVGGGDIYHSSNAFVVNKNGTTLANDYKIVTTDAEGNEIILSLLDKITTLEAEITALKNSRTIDENGIVSL